MIKLILSAVLCFSVILSVSGQIIVVPGGSGSTAAAATFEHGFLPGKQFKIYPTAGKYDFKGRKLRVKLIDDRDNVKLKRVQCSDIELTNKSEFVDAQSIYKVEQYIDTLFRQSGITIDSTAAEALTIRFEGVDGRLYGAGYVRVHGLCQMKISYNNITKTYCSNISDADKNSPISPTAVVTRKTATRAMVSASFRDVIEQFLVDFKSYVE
jgi:hypothetical protein